MEFTEIYHKAYQIVLSVAENLNYSYNKSFMLSYGMMHTVM